MVRLLVGPSQKTHSLIGHFHCPTARNYFSLVPDPSLSLSHTLSLAPSFFLTLSKSQALSHALSHPLSLALALSLALSPYTMIYQLIFTFLLMDLELINNLFASPLQLV